MSTTYACKNYFVLQSLHKALPSTTLYYKTCKKHVPVVLCTAKFAENTFQYYFVLQSLRKVLPSTTLYCKACKKYFPVLLCTTKLAKSTSQYYFVLQSLHKVFPGLLSTTKLAQSTSQYYFVLQSLEKHVPVLLCTTKLAQSTTQYYFVLQSLHKALPSTSLYGKACTNYFPVLLCTTQLKKVLPSAHQRRNNSARFPSFLNLTTSKAKQFCETSSFFTLDNIKNKAILRHFLQKWKVECSADSLVPIRFAIFPLHLSKVLRLPQKIDARSYKVLHLSRKIILANLQI